MRKSPLSEVLRPKDLLNPYVAAGIAGRIGAKVELGSFSAKSLDRLMAKIALSTVSLEGDGVGVSYDNTSLWHGTGRYKYTDGDVKDVLVSIADDGSIAPNLDKFDFNGPMESVSLARSRVYARAYADMYSDSEDRRERYGSSLFWASAFLGSVAIEASRELEVWKPSGYYEMVRHLGRAGVAEWYKKVTSMNDISVVNVYRDGSDIDDNYPILFGVRDLQGIETSKAVAIHEVRTDRPLDLDSDITHVEVPRRHINETRRILAGVAIRAIEDGESYCSNFTFTEHMHELV